MVQFKPKKFQTKTGKLLEIRSFDLEDVEANRLFFNRGADETTHTLVCKEKPISEEKLKERIKNALSSSYELYIGAFNYDEVLGSLHFRIQNPDHPWIKHVGEFGILILKDHWDQGIGKEFLSIMEGFAIKVGVSRIEARVRCNNGRGIAFYQSSGFEIEGTSKNAACIEGNFIDEYYIAKLFSPN